MANLSEIHRRSPEASSHLLHGLSLPVATLQALQRRGIYCTSGVTVEHQHLAKRYVLRGVESGGAVADMGRTCAFLSPDGLPLPWLQSIDSLAVNGRHAIILAESLVRIEMLRTVRTCELSISLHTLSLQPGRTRPEITSKSVFRGRDGVLSVELWKEEHRTLRGELAPIFYTRAGEPMQVPRRFEEAIRKVTTAVCCVGCKHAHVSISPQSSEVAL
ncbi:hypothetical protein [Acidicapsa ligni]|uniref:hypothetical protein n=1 Tax=Acidicapsa ligni TaxID=542300 RepID=UPI0021E03EAF|nr:hypothetical protein [Acidicapsa ligni]